MAENNSRALEASELRKRAEEIARKESVPSPEMSEAQLPENVRRTLHELRVHQIELEMQNVELRASQADLGVARTHFSDLYNLAPVGYCTVNEQGLILEANLTAATLLGVARRSLIKKYFSLSILKEDRDLYYLRQKPFFATRAASSGQAPETLSLELRMLKPDGNPVWVNLVSTLAEDAGGAPVCHIAIIDISERKRAESYKELAFQNEEKEKRVAELILAQELALQKAEKFRVVADFTYDWEEWRAPNGAILYTSPSCERITGHTVAEFMGDPNLVIKISHPDDQSKVKEQLREAQEQPSIEFDFRIITPAGDIRWISHLSTAVYNEAGEWIGRRTSNRDSTEHKKMEDVLRESEDRFSRLAEQIGIFVWDVDAQGLYTYVSPVVEKVLGYRPDEVIGRMHFYDFHPESDREAFKKSTFSVFAQQQAFHNLENTAQTKDGRQLWLSTNGLPRLDAAGKLLGYRGSDTDITARKQADAEQHKLQKLQSIGTLAGGIAHDFNNIMVGVFGNISLAKEELAQDHPGHLLLAEAEQSIGRAVRLTTQLLTFAKGGDPVKEDVGLGTLVEAIARFDLVGGAVKLVYQQAPELWSAVVDKGQMQQVISNLTINARQAMPDGGSLHLTLANADVSDTGIPGLRPGKYVQITMRDEGTGIDPKNIDRIFDPYFTTKQSGHGLGLATAYSIINKHGGHIGVRSELGRGTTFTLYLPASGAPLRAETVPSAAAAPPLDRPAKILVMDDEDAVCRLVERALTRCRFEVAAAPGGQEAIAMYQQAMTDGAPFDVVLMDLTIPGGMGGKDAIKELLAIDPHAKAIVSSGYADDPVMANYADYGFKGCVTKPYTTSELRAVLAQIVK